MEGDMEGAPPFGEPILSGLLGMLYAVGYGDGFFRPEEAPVPFMQRERHGLFRHSPDRGESDLVLSTADILAIIRQLHLPRVLGDTEAPGRNRYRVCHHPVFSRDGGKLLVNTLEGRDAVVCEIDMAAALGD
ncbi:hypothetical protein [Paenibacillus agaridevorans]|uniref:hypothetical protein n=1 Tax=Paenibacillus agaridevorans TaxID=171404 RepID=UPI001BE4869C|nr:hypothetical protein [Paenibacillus agaridevorans]